VNFALAALIALPAPVTPLAMAMGGASAGVLYGVRVLPPGFCNA